MDKAEPKSLNSTFKFLFETKKLSDITFVVHGEDIAAHKLVVASRSPVFEAMIASDLAPKDGKHAIDDPEITFDDFNNFLEFLYTDSCAMTNENIDQLLHLGNFYNVEYLIYQCFQYIDEAFISCTMLKYAELGLLYGDSCTLLDLCISKLPIAIRDFPLKFFKEDGSTQWISPELAVKIVEKCPRTEDLTEEVLFEKVFDWALNGQRKKRTKDINVVLTPLIPFIEFEDLQPITLATVVRNYNLLDSLSLANVLSAAIKRTEEEQRRQRVREIPSPAYSYSPPYKMMSQSDSSRSRSRSAYAPLSPSYVNSRSPYDSPSYSLNTPSYEPS